MVQNIVMYYFIIAVTFVLGAKFGADWQKSKDKKIVKKALITIQKLKNKK